MIYEGTIQFTEKTKSGNDRVVKHQYLIDNCNTFGDAEDLLFVENDGLRDLDVIAVKRSKLKEIANKRQDEKDVIWIADVQDTFVDDNGEEKYNVYKIAFFSTTFDSAKAFITEYLKQGYGDMELISLKKSNFLDIIK